MDGRKEGIMKMGKERRDEGKWGNKKGKGNRGGWVEGREEGKWEKKKGNEKKDDEGRIWRKEGVSYCYSSVVCFKSA